MIKAAITPGTQPQIHNMVTMIIEPQPLSMIANGGHKIDRMTLQILMMILILIDVVI